MKEIVLTRRMPTWIFFVLPILTMFILKALRILEIDIGRLDAFAILIFVFGPLFLICLRYSR